MIARGQSSSMSRAIATISGIVRRARKMPLGPRVSPMLVSMPYFLGMRMSCCQTLVAPRRMVTQTASAPARAWRRSVVVVTLAPYPPWATSFSQARRAKSSRCLAMSTRAISEFSRRSKVSRSRTRLRVKPKLPAPMKTTFAIADSPISLRKMDLSTVPAAPGQFGRGCIPRLKIAERFALPLRPAPGTTAARP